MISRQITERVIFCHLRPFCTLC